MKDDFKETIVKVENLILKTVFPLGIVGFGMLGYAVIVLL